MSVLECSRNNCENIMCTNYSHLYGYICDDCLNELIMYGKYTNIEVFLETPKQHTKYEEDASIYFKEIFEPT